MPLFEVCTRVNFDRRLFTTVAVGCHNHCFCALRDSISLSLFRQLSYCLYLSLSLSNTLLLSLSILNTLLLSLSILNTLLLSLSILNTLYLKHTFTLSLASFILCKKQQKKSVVQSRPIFNF